MMSLGLTMDRPPTADCSLFDPDHFADRDSFIRYLVNTCGWKIVKVAKLFGLSRRQAQRIARHGAACAGNPDVTSLSAEEKQDLLDEYARDPESRAHLKTLRVWLDGEPEKN